MVALSPPRSLPLRRPKTRGRKKGGQGVTSLVGTRFDLREGEQHFTLKLLAHFERVDVDPAATRSSGLLATPDSRGPIPSMSKSLDAKTTRARVSTDSEI